MHRVLITTGGTGGHIFPALAGVEELRRNNPDLAVLFVGGASGQEAELARKNNLEFLGLPVRGFFGRGLKATDAAARLLLAIPIAGKRIRTFRPEVALGFGGYAAVPGLLAARALRIPTLIHEQNSMPGMANRFLGRMADRVCIALPDAASAFKPEKTVLTGNPVRASIRALSGSQRERARGRFGGAGAGNLLVLGGSQGARAVNNALLDDLSRLLEAGLNVWIQTGESDYGRVCENLSAYAVETGGGRIKVEPFIDGMNEAYAWADLAICRAGATTLAELAVAGLPALFIPFPFSTHNHQFHNAEQARKAGAALVLEQKDIVKGSLAALALAAVQSEKRLKVMAEAFRTLARPEAAAKVAEEAEKLAGRKSAD